MQEVKSESARKIAALKNEKDQLNAKLAELRGRLDGVERKLRGEEERAARHDKAIQQANATFEKLLDSTATLAEFVKKEYQDAKREAGGEH